VLHELGAGAILSAQDAEKETPAHYAAADGHEGCLRVLHECQCRAHDRSSAQGLSRFRSATTTAATHELEAKRSLATRSGTNETPTHQAAVEGYTGCVRFLSEI
jgi:hypothetical protein